MRLFDEDNVASWESLLKQLFFCTREESENLE